MGLEEVVFADTGARWADLGQIVATLAVCAAGSTVVAWWACPASSESASPKEWTRSWAVSVVLGFRALVMVGMTAYCMVPFHRLRLESDAVRLEFERPWIEQERLPWRRVSKVVAGGGGGRGTWARGCRVRLWLVGGGSEVSAFDPRMPRAQCEAIRDRLEAARRAATGA